MDAFIVDAVRTPRGRGREGGALSDVKPIELLAQTFQALDARTGASQIVEDIVVGCVTATGEQGANIAKIGALYAGWPPISSGLSINSFCASGVASCALAGQKVAVGSEQVVVAGGVESMSRVPMFGDQGAWFADKAVAKATKFMPVGIAADLVATKENIDRDSLDAFAVESHRRAAIARDEGRFDDSLVPVMNDAGEIVLVMDENIRRDATIETIGALPPAFEKLGEKGFDALAVETYPEIGTVRHLHTVANAPAAADGAAAILVANAAGLKNNGLEPRARIVAAATAAACPVLKLTASNWAAEKVLHKAGLGADEIDIWEINEGFAVVPLLMMRHFGLDPARVNPNGGSIALGHAMGATGAMLAGMAVDELERSGGRYAAVVAGGGAGLAAALILERV